MHHQGCVIQRSAYKVENLHPKGEIQKDATLVAKIMTKVLLVSLLKLRSDVIKKKIQVYYHVLLNCSAL